MCKEYNGHPSWAHWNATLWAFNDEGLYRTLLEGNDKASLLMEIMPITPDGAEVTPEIAQYVAQCFDDEC